MHPEAFYVWFGISFATLTNPNEPNQPSRIRTIKADFGFYLRFRPACFGFTRILNFFGVKRSPASRLVGLPLKPVGAVLVRGLAWGFGLRWSLGFCSRSNSRFGGRSSWRSFFS